MRSTRSVETFGLIDCNNFYVSCERLARPDLEGKPVVVLSNNDGNAISRSNESKALGVKMGDPAFKIRDLVARENIVLFSSNYELYGDLSRRVNDVLSSMIPSVESYSIDESFLDLGEFAPSQVDSLARALRDRVLRWTGIPTCVGIGPTKTLAKVANFMAKKRPGYSGVCDLRSADVRSAALCTVPVGEVWGIGSASTSKLERLGVKTAADLAAMNGDEARSLLTVTGSRVVQELRGISCMPLERVAPTRQGIAVTRSFGRAVTEWLEMSEAIASHASRAAEKLRRSGVATDHVYVFMQTSPFNREPFHSAGATAHFNETTNDTGEMVRRAVHVAERLWRGGHRYAKAGVILTDLVPETCRLTSLWGVADRDRRDRAWRAMDDVNGKIGRGTVRVLSSGGDEAAWKPRAEHRSPRWTTRWGELPRVSAR